MLVKLKMQGRGPGTVVTVESGDLDALATLACKTFCIPTAILFTGFPPTRATEVRDNDLVEVREPPPLPPPPFSVARFAVPGDNSCLFHSIGFLLYGGAIGAHSAALRAEVAKEVLSNRVAWTAVILGRSNEEYAEFITRPKTWGGATEMQILSQVRWWYLPRS